MRILQVCNKVPYPPKDGGCIAMNNLTHGLLKEGHQVKVLAINTQKHYTEIKELPETYRARTNIEAVFIDTSVKAVPAFLNLFSKGSYNISRFYSPAFEAKLAEILQKDAYDIVQLESLFVSMYIPVIRRHSKAKIVLRAHNIEHKLWERNADASGSFLKKKYFSFLADRLKIYELSTVKEYDGVAAITAGDARWFSENGFSSPLSVIPFGMDLDSVQQKKVVAEDKASVFHIGAMDWQPNIEGVNWFLEKVWDKVLQQHPDVKLYLAGRKISNELKSLNSKNIEVTGEVADAHEFILSKGLMIVPLLSGGGMRVKLIEGMALGKVVLSTSIGAEGVECEDGMNILIADDPDAFASVIGKYLSDKNYLAPIGARAKQFAAEYYNNDDISRKLSGFYKLILQA
jgi:glycosyltransferase involved in cell wall biosynthesis